MTSEFEKFNDLPDDLKKEAIQNLSNRELIDLSTTSIHYSGLFQPVIDVRKLLHHVTRGEHDAVKAMLMKDISLIFKSGIVTDCSGREFKNVSPFEYALWALDKHMWATMIACIPQNEEGRKVFEQLIAQYNKVNTIGVTYKLNEETITEQHFDFENTIIKELQTQADSVNAAGNKDWDAIDKQWREGVGGAQKLLPMHVVYEYCSNETFYPVPKFTEQPKSSKEFYNRTTNKAENWFSVDSKLSVEVAIDKSGGQGAVGNAKAPNVSIDLDAMTKLCKVRTKDFLALKSQLEDQMKPDNHHQASQI